MKASEIVDKFKSVLLNAEVDSNEEIKEVSDIADMRYLLENLYTQFPEALLEQERTQELMANGNYK